MIDANKLSIVNFALSKKEGGIQNQLMHLNPLSDFSIYIEIPFFHKQDVSKQI